MAAAPDDDARRTLAELEAKLRELERELLRGHEPAAPPPPDEPPPAETFAPEPDLASAAEPDLHPEPGVTAPRAPDLSAPPEPDLTAPPEPEPPIDFDALRDAHDLLAGLRATIDELGLTAERVTTEAHAVIDDHGRTLGRLERAGEAAARAEQAAIEAGRLAATVVVEAGPFADAAAVGALRDALAAQPGAREAYVRGVEDGRAVIEVHLAPPRPPSRPATGAEPPGEGTPWA